MKVKVTITETYKASFIFDTESVDEFNNNFENFYENMEEYIQNELDGGYEGRDIKYEFGDIEDDEYLPHISRDELLAHQLS